MEFVPYSHFLLHKILPYAILLCLFQLVLCNALTMSASPYHVKQTCNTIEGISHYDDCLVRSELSLTHALRKMSLYNPYLFIANAFALQSHFVQLPIQRPSQVAITTGIDLGQSLEISAHQRISRARVRCQQYFLYRLSF
jgi:hypothetical protein